METKTKRSSDVLEAPQPVGEKAPAFTPTVASQVVEERANVARSAFRKAIAKLGDIFGVEIAREANPVESFANVLALVQKLRDDLKVAILSDPKIDSGRRASLERILFRTLDSALALQSLSTKLDAVGPQMEPLAQEGGDESLSMIISSVNRLATSLPIRVVRLQRVLSILVSKRDQQDVPIEGLISDLYERELSSNLSTNQVELGKLAELSRPIGISEGFGSGGKTVLVSNGKVLELHQRLLHEGSMVVCNGAGDLVPLERFIEQQLPEVEIWQEVSLSRGSDNARLPQLTYDVSPNGLMQFGVPHRCTLVDLKFIRADGSPIEADNLSLKRSVFGAWQVQPPQEAVKMVATVTESNLSGISDNLLTRLQQLLPRTTIPLDPYMKITLAQALKEPYLARRAMIVANGFAENSPVYHISNQLGQALSAAGSNRLAFLSGLHGGTCETMSAQLINLLNLVGVPAKLGHGLTIQAGETNYRGDPGHAVVRCFVPGGRDLVFDPTTWTISGGFEPERLEDSDWRDLIQSLKSAGESEAFELGRNLRERLYTDEPSSELSRHQLRDDRDLNDPTQAELLLEAAHDSVIHLHTEMAIKYQQQGLDDPLAKATEDIGKLLASIREIDPSDQESLSKLSDTCGSTQIGKVSPIEKLALLELCRANWDGLWGTPVSWPWLVRNDHFLHPNKMARAFYKRPFESVKQQVVLRKFNFSSLPLSPEHSLRVTSSLSEKIAQRPSFSARGGWRDLVLTGDARGRRAVPDRTDEIGQLRQYVRGDDLRRVDWRASGKSDTLLVRSYLGGAPRQSESFKLKIDAEALIAPGKNREQILTAIYDFIQVTRLEKRSVAVEVSYRGVVLQEIEASEVEEAFMRGKPLGMDLLLRLERIGEDAYRVSKSLAQINSAGSAAFDTGASVPSDRSRGGGKNSTINVLVCHPANRLPTLTALDAAKIESFVLWPR